MATRKKVVKELPEIWDVNTGDKVMVTFVGIVDHLDSSEHTLADMRVTGSGEDEIYVPLDKTRALEAGFEVEVLEKAYQYQDGDWIRDAEGEFFLQKGGKWVTHEDHEWPNNPTLPFTHFGPIEH